MELLVWCKLVCFNEICIILYFHWKKINRERIKTVLIVDVMIKHCCSNLSVFWKRLPIHPSKKLKTILMVTYVAALVSLSQDWTNSSFLAWIIFTLSIRDQPTNYLKNYSLSLIDSYLRQHQLCTTASLFVSHECFSSQYTLFQNGGQ